jgi:hypothetical protein
MSKKVIQDLKKEIASRERELQALVDAVNLILSAAPGPGRKGKFKSNVAGILAAMGKADRKAGKTGTGRRGRPKGSKNRPGAAKPGPKPKADKAAPTAAPKKASGKGPGRPAKKAAAGKKTATKKSAVKKAAVIAKPAVKKAAAVAKPAVKKVAPRKAAAKKPAVKATPATPSPAVKKTAGPVIIPSSDSSSGN